MNRINKIAVELEGGWNGKPSGVEMHADGSVDVGGRDCDYECDCDHTDSCFDDDGELVCSGDCCSCETELIQGEIASDPMDLNELLKFTEEKYPDVVNSSCGLHIHVSFKDRLSYMQLMSEDFYNYFLQRVTIWGQQKKIRSDSAFWRRLAGENTFCKKAFNAEAQARVSGKDGVRYCHLNYCYRLHKTLECRLFPAFKKKELALSAIQLFHDIVESYLEYQRKEEPIVAEIIDDEPEITQSEVITL